MKRVLCVAMAISLLGSSVAWAADSHRGRGGGHGFGRGDHVSYPQGRHHRGHNNNGAAAIGLGILAFGLIGVLASQSNNRRQGYYAPYDSYPPPGPGYGPGYGYDDRTGYRPTDTRYGQGYGDGYGGGSYGYANAQIVVCASGDYRFQRCAFPVGGRVELVRQLSQSNCQFNRSWGYDRDGIWVNRGCRAEFAVF